MTRDDLPDDELTTRFSAVLNSEADTYEPTADSLARIRERTAASSGRSVWRWAAPLAAAAVAVGVASAVVLLPHGGQTAQPLPGAPTPTVSTTVTPSPSDVVLLPTPAPSSSPNPACAMSGPYIPVPRYVIGTFEGRSALYREYFAFNHCDDTGFSQVGQAVNSLGWDPADRERQGDGDGFQSLWPVGMTMSAFSRSGSSASVTVTDPPKDTATIELALQELVYTVTAADNTIKTVTVTMPVAMDSPLGKVYPDLTRAPQSEVLAPVWLTQAFAEEVSGKYLIHMTGTASVFEATVNWVIKDQDGRVVDQGNAMTPEAAPARGAWTATSKPLPNDGYYTVTAYEASPMDGRVTWPDSGRAP